MIFVEEFEKDVSYSIFFALCEIMSHANGYLKFKKDFSLLQPLAILKN